MILAGIENLSYIEEAKSEDYYGRLFAEQSIHSSDENEPGYALNDSFENPYLHDGSQRSDEGSDIERNWDQMLQRAESSGSSGGSSFGTQERLSSTDGETTTEPSESS